MRGLAASTKGPIWCARRYEPSFHAGKPRRTRSMTAGLLVFTLLSKPAQGVYSKSASTLNGPHAIHMEKEALASLGGGKGILIGGN